MNGLSNKKICRRFGRSRHLYANTSENLPPGREARPGQARRGSREEQVSQAQSWAFKNWHPARRPTDRAGRRRRGPKAAEGGGRGRRRWPKEAARRPNAAEGGGGGGRRRPKQDAPNEEQADRDVLSSALLFGRSPPRHHTSYRPSLSLTAQGKCRYSFNNPKC